MTRIREVTENDDFSYFVSTKLPCDIENNFSGIHKVVHPLY